MLTVNHVVVARFEAIKVQLVLLLLQGHRFVFQQSLLNNLGYFFVSRTGHFGGHVKVLCDVLCQIRVKHAGKFYRDGSGI